MNLDNSRHTGAPRSQLAPLAQVGVALGILLLAACGGGGSSGAATDDPPVAGTEVPSSATTSAQGAFSFVSSVAATGGEAAEPLVLGDAVLATSDTDEPQAL